MTTTMRAEQQTLYSVQGERKYLNADERRRLLDCLSALPRERALFVATLFWTGARVSEVLALRGPDIQVSQGSIALRTLKRRRFQMREVPVPATLLTELERTFALSSALARKTRLWPWCRCTAWRMVSAIMDAAGLSGPSATPRGLRHSHAIHALHSGVPLNFVQRWLGHSRMETTAIYATAMGPDERLIAERMWSMDTLQKGKPKLRRVAA